MATIIVMNRFDEIGVERQNSAKTFGQAKRSFDKSCGLCAMYHRYSDCAACPIRQAMLNNKVRWTKLNSSDQIWLEKEEAVMA